MTDEFRRAMLNATFSKSEHQVIIYCPDKLRADKLFDIILRIINTELVDAD